jgi:hypothetical protein
LVLPSKEIDMAEKAAEAGTPKPGEEKPAEQKPAEQKPAEQKPAEQKPAEQKPAEQKPGEQKAAEPSGKAGETPKAPAKYALELPEGGRLDAADVAAVEKLARENDWTNDKAQAELLERSTLLEAAASQFLAETTADPVYGGDHLAETQRLANLALDRVQPKGTPAGDRTRAALKKTGLGNHLVFVSLMADVGKLMAEDSPIVGRASAGGARKPTDEVLYDKTAAATT